MNKNKKIMRSKLEVYMKKVKPYAGVIFIQFGFAGQTILAKTALNKGMNHFTFSVYRNAIAALVFAPFAIFFERKVRPQMTISIFFKLFLLALLEPVIDQNLFYAGMKYTTATVSVALVNLIPGLIFIMAWICRLEKVNIKSLYSQGKIMGTLVSLGGAMLMSLFKGPIIGLPWTNDTNIHQHSSSAKSVNHHDSIKGSLMIALGCFCWACFTVLQAITLKSYPAELSLTALVCGMGALQGTILTFAVEKANFAIWSIRWDTALFAALYGGIICSGVSYYVAGVIMKDRGPVFVTAFNPLAMVIVAILSSFILAENLDLGSVLGATLIVTGLYLVIWGKKHDQASPGSEKDQEAGAATEITTPKDDVIVSVTGRKLSDAAV